VSGSIGGISDSVTQALHVALNGLDARQRAISSNLANIETPGYHALEVNFEDSLREAVAKGDPMRAQTSTTESLAATRINGNNVNIDFEVLTSSENVLRQKLVVQALNNKYSLLRTAISG
jgi:flagellar basal-body rod protein FlgB